MTQWSRPRRVLSEIMRVSQVPPRDAVPADGPGQGHACEDGRRVTRGNGRLSLITPPARGLSAALACRCNCSDPRLRNTNRPCARPPAPSHCCATCPPCRRVAGLPGCSCPDTAQATDVSGTAPAALSLYDEASLDLGLVRLDQQSETGSLGIGARPWARMLPKQVWRRRMVR